MKKKIVVICLIIVAVTLAILGGYGTYLKTSAPEPEAVNDSWTVTSYRSMSEEQMMGFYVEGNVDGLVLIDGGYKDVEAEVENVLETIRKHDNVVDAWIITHLDSDHVGVFLNIVQTHPEVAIKKVYTSVIAPEDRAKEQAPWESDWSCYEDFVGIKLNTNMDITVLVPGDTIDDIIGLKMDVLWAYTPWVDEHSNNIINNGALCFKLVGPEKSMLFFSDIQDGNVAKVIQERYPEKLKSNYVQIAHHGNNGYDSKIYDIIEPEVAFIPATDRIFENPDNISWYTASKIRSLLIGKGTTVYSDKDAPASVTLK